MTEINQVLDQEVLDKIEKAVKRASYVPAIDKDDLRSFLAVTLIEAYYAGKDMAAATTSIALKRRTIDFARRNNGETSRINQARRLQQEEENQPGRIEPMTFHRSLGEASTEFEDETVTSMNVHNAIEMLVENGTFDEIDLRIVSNLMNGESPANGLKFNQSTATRRIRRVRTLLKENIDVMA